MTRSHRITLLLFSLITVVNNISAQVVDADIYGSVSHPLYFNKTDLALTTSHLQFGMGGGVYVSSENAHFYYGASFNYHFITSDSASLQQYDSRNPGDDHYLNVKASIRYGNSTPEFGFFTRSASNPLLTMRIGVGIGVAWSSIEYDTSAFSAQTYTFANVPWNISFGSRTREGFITSVLPCMALKNAWSYEFRYFDLFGCGSICYAFGELPGVQLTLDGGIRYFFNRTADGMLPIE